MAPVTKAKTPKEPPDWHAEARAAYVHGDHAASIAASLIYLSQKPEVLPGFNSGDE